MNVSDLILQVYDVESYPNFFSVDFQCVATKQHYYFEVSDWHDDTEQLIEHCRDCWRRNVFLVGFRNTFYDQFILFAFLKRTHTTPAQLWELTQKIIGLSKDEFYKHQIYPDDRLLKQIDLFKIHHFDNQARQTSLKSLQFNMRLESVEDLPFPPGTVLTAEQAAVIRKYNPHDTGSTTAFTEFSADVIKFRADLKQKYPRKDWYNFADTKIGKEYFVMMLAEKGIKCYEKVNGRNQPRQTIRNEIRLADAILPDIKFKTPAFQYVLGWLKAQVITETKGIFSDWRKISNSAGQPDGVYEYNKGRFEPTKKKITKKQQAEFPLLPLSPGPDAIYLPNICREFRVFNGELFVKGLSAFVNRFQFDFGTGGIHGSLSQTTVESCKDWQIVDIDVASYYPNLAIANDFYPEHLGSNFCSVYKMLYKERKKHGKGTAANKMIKLGLNGVYGESNSAFSVFYDPLYTMKITLNGQLLLCLLAEMIWSEIADAQLIQVNTDGLTVKVKQTDRYTLDQIVRQWEQRTKLQMETALYKKMCIRDVNNYLAVYNDGTVKRKGAYEYLSEQYKGGTLGWHKNHSALVVPKVVEQVLVHGKDPEETLRYWPDKFDFMIRAKVQRTGKFVLELEKDNNYQELQKINRVYASNDGHELFKLLPVDGHKKPKQGFFEFAGEKWRKSAFMKEQTITVANNVCGLKIQDMNINYSFYLDEVHKLLKGLTTTFDEET